MNCSGWKEVTVVHLRCGRIHSPLRYEINMNSGHIYQQGTIIQIQGKEATKKKEKLGRNNEKSKEWKKK
jgi:hypothetical protein